MHIMFNFNESQNRLEMIEGDFGIKLPIQIEGITLEENDSIALKVFKEINTNPIISKTFTNILNNTVELEFSKEESKLLDVGNYYYDIDWFQGEKFLGNIAAKKKFSVREKAGA